MNMQVGQNNSSNVAAKNNGQELSLSQSTEDPKLKEEAEKLKKELEQRTKNLEDRVRGASTNLSSSEESYREYKNSWNFFRGMGGEGAALEKQIETERKYKENLETQRQMLLETQSRVAKLMKEGNYALAKAVMEGKEQEYKQKISQASSQAMKGLQDTNKKLEETDKFLTRTETVLRTTRDGCVVAAAIVATGGAASAGFVAAAAAGTAAGTVVGGLSNLAEAGSHVANGNKGLGDALSDAAVQTGKDALTSAQIGISGGAGAATGKFLLGQAGKEVAKQVAISTTKKVVVGMAAGATSGFTGSALQTSTNLAMGTEQRSWGQIGTDTLRGTVVGSLSGGIGAKGQAGIDQMAANGTNTIMRTLAVKATADVAAPTALSLGSSYGSHYLFGTPAPTLEQSVQEVSMAILSSHVGAKTVANQQSGRTIKQEFTEMPTFAAMGTSIKNLYARQTPLPLVPKSTLQIPSQKVEVPKEVKDGSSFKASEKKGEVSVTKDETLPEGVEAQAISIEKEGRRSTEIKLSKEHADGVENKTPASLRKLEHEVAHANQKMIDPVKVDGSGNKIIMTEAEYMARRAFQELEARAHTDRAFDGIENIRELSEMSDLILGSKDYEKALAVAKEYGLTDADVANYKADYKNNINPNRDRLVQTSNSTETASEFVVESAETYESYGVLEKVIASDILIAYNKKLIAMSRNGSQLQTLLKGLSEKGKTFEEAVGDTKYKSKDGKSALEIARGDLEAFLEQNQEDVKIADLFGKNQGASSTNKSTNKNEEIAAKHTDSFKPQILKILDELSPLLEKNGKNGNQVDSNNIRRNKLERLLDPANPDLQANLKHLNKLANLKSQRIEIPDELIQSPKILSSDQIKAFDEANTMADNGETPLKISNKLKFEFCSNPTDKKLANDLGTAIGDNNYGIRSKAIELLEGANNISYNDIGNTKKFIERLIDANTKLKAKGLPTKDIGRIFDEAFDSYKNPKDLTLQEAIKGRYYEAYALEYELNLGMHVWAMGVKSQTNLVSVLKEIQKTYSGISIKFPNYPKDFLGTDIDMIMVDPSNPNRVIFVENKSSKDAKKKTNELQERNQKIIARDYDAIRVEKIQNGSLRKTIDTFDPKIDSLDN